ncbi:MAG: alpha/beta family hydrolase [Thermomicrobiales bacterium]
MPHTTRFTLTNRHGQRIVGLIDEPEGDAPIPRALVLCHGYGGDKDGRYLQRIAALTAAGAATIRFDFTNGAGESDGTLAGASVSGYADDLDDVLDFVAQQPRLAAAAPAIGGHSYAGRVVLTVAGRRAGLAAVYFLCGVYERPGDNQMASVVARITAPIVIITAAADREVPLAHAEALARAAGDKIAAFETIPGADHNFLAPGTADHLARIIQETFFQLTTSL